LPCLTLRRFSLGRENGFAECFYGVAVRQPAKLSCH
jgi:hypothetical protein